MLNKSDYEIVDYYKNVVKGTANVTIKGTDNYGGVKVGKFVIAAKSMNYTVVYNKNADDVTRSMKNSVTASSSKVTANAYKRTGHSFAGWSMIPGSLEVVIKNRGALTMSGATEYGSTINLYAQWVK